MNELSDQARQLIRNVAAFSERAGKIKLRGYQESVAKAVIESILNNKGLSFVVIFPRQSGKNELQAQIEANLLTALSTNDVEIVKVSPTWKPQSLNAMRRLQRVLENNPITRKKWRKEYGYIYRVGKARIFFFSGSPEANIVGATASTLLEVDEAQDIATAKYDKDIAPMAASANATRVFYGTAWTSRTLLARELRAAQAAEKRDGVRRAFVLTALEVGAEVEAYRKFVDEQIAKFGRANLMVRTQFFSEEIDAEGGMFPAARVAMMKGEHGEESGPQPEGIYCLLVDVAGEDENAAGGVETHPDQSIGAGDVASLQNRRRDSTALTVLQVDLSTMSDPVIMAPTYRVMRRRQWVGVKHTRLYAEIKALAALWRVKWLVIDATGVGAGLASFLGNAMPGKVLPFIFNAKTKSELGWAFLGVIDSGRWKESTNFANFTNDLSQSYSRENGGAEETEEGEFFKQPSLWQVEPRLNQEEFFNQLSFCQYEITPGPEKKMRWGVADGTRDPATGELVHDDLILSAALVGVLEEQTWTVSRPTLVIQAADPLADMEKGF